MSGSVFFEMFCPRALGRGALALALWVLVLWSRLLVLCIMPTPPEHPNTLQTIPKDENTQNPEKGA